MGIMNSGMAYYKALETKPGWPEESSAIVLCTQPHALVKVL